MKNKKLLPNEFELAIFLHVPPSIREDMRKLINLARWGKPHCNVYDKDGRIVRDPELTPEIEKELVNKHFNMTVTRKVTLIGKVDIKIGEVDYRFKE